MNRRHRPSPSFSSSLLDEIYRSIDIERESVRGAECKMRERVGVRHNYWSSSSSESSGGFSSSEAESRSSYFRSKPVRTGLPVQNQKLEPVRDQVYKAESNAFGKTKSKAMKIYGHFKKVKQPISPGGRLATFLNSFFTTPKKPKTSSFDEAISKNNPKSKQSCTSTCSSASSFSRSCLSNSSSRDKTSDMAKRSVKFYPVSVILGEDNYKNGMRNNTINDELKIHIMEKNRRVDEAARDLLKKYQHVENNHDKKFNYVDDEDDDGASYASSDLFELDHLSAIEELPVYETTHLRTNLAIANGLIS